MKKLWLKSALRAGSSMWFAIMLFYAPLAHAAEGSDPEHIVFVTAEHSKFYGSGGLGEMIDGLTRGLEEEYRESGVPTHLTVVMPFYMRFYQEPGKVESFHDEGQEVRVGLDYGYSTEARRHEIFRAYSKWHGRVKVVLLRHMNRVGERNYFDNQLVDGKGPLYAPADLEWEAFAAFGKASAILMYRHLRNVDLAVFNDWHSATGAYFLRRPEFIGFGDRARIRSFGISHNFAFQGITSARMATVIGFDTRDSGI